MIENMPLRLLQKESALAMTIFNFSNYDLSHFNKLAPHNSQKWHAEIIKFYISKYGDLPSKIGPASEIKLLYTDV